MHYSNLVIVENNVDRSLEDAVSDAMDWGKDVWWDFWQIGGRWTGFFDGYDPDKDDALLETCIHCHGTGKRHDMDVKNGCNGCQGTGKARLWPTQWPLRKEDSIPVEQLTEEHIEKSFRVICEGYRHEFGGEDYWPWKHNTEGVFTRREKPPLEWIKTQFARHLAVIVDSHN